MCRTWILNCLQSAANSVSKREQYPLIIMSLPSILGCVNYWWPTLWGFRGDICFCKKNPTLAIISYLPPTQQLAGTLITSNSPRLLSPAGSRTSSSCAHRGPPECSSHLRVLIQMEWISLLNLNELLMVNASKVLVQRSVLKLLMLPQWKNSCSCYYCHIKGPI